MMANRTRATDRDSELRQAEMQMIGIAMLMWHKREEDHIRALGLSADDFGDGDASAYWQAIIDLLSSGKPLTSLAIADASGKPQERISECIDRATTTRGADYVANKILAGSYARRRIAVLRAAVEEDLTSSEIKQRLDQIPTPGSSRGVVVGDELQRVVSLSEARAKSGDSVIGITTGFRALDRRLAGLPRGGTVIIGADTGGAKTAMTLAIGCGVAQNMGVVSHYSLEDSAVGCLFRLAAQTGMVDLHGLRAGTLSRDDLEYARKAGLLAKSTIAKRMVINDRLPGSRFDLCAAEIERDIAARGVDLWCVDYIQNMHDPRAATRSRADEIALMSSTMADIARNTNTCAIIVSQFNREASGQRPRKHNLSGAGALEQHAHTIILLEAFPSVADNGFYIVLHVDKMKDGPVGDVFMRWRPNFVLPSELAPGEEDAARESYEAFDRSRAARTTLRSVSRNV